MNLPSFLKNLFGTSQQSTNGHSAQDKRLEAIRKNCWIPIVEPGDGEPTASKFSGIPYLGPDMEWPICPNCHNPMQLFLQLNSGSLPEGCRDIWGEGLLQFFYCTNLEPMCEVDCQAFFPFSKSTVLRVVEANGDHSWHSPSPVKDVFPAKQIVGWEERDDLPNPEEQSELGVELPEAVVEELCETYPRGGEKLLGWPMWVQGVEYPKCPKCDTRMQLIFQIDSETNLPWMFGDVGCGHISQCPTHRMELGFGWACS